MLFYKSNGNSETKELQHVKWEKQSLDELKRRLETEEERDKELEHRSIKIIQSEKQRKKDFFKKQSFSDL